MDRYEKLKTIGRGQYGEAMLCRTVGGSHEKVVVKRVSIELMNRIERKQALAEVTFLSTLKHPNVVDYRENLSAYIKAAKQPLEEALILDWFIQLCMACRYIHSRKILHRDLKSNNVFITDRSIIKLGDFGIARVLSSTLDHASTVVGTPYYMSPEVCENKPYFFFLKYFSKIHTYKSDLWAVGCILYEMCARLYQIVQGKYTSLPKGYSQGMRGLVSSLLKKNPNQRADYAKIFSTPIIRNQIAELERTGGSIGQKLRKVSKMNSKRNKINKNKISESKVNGQSEQRHLLVMLTPAERARRRKQRSKDLARELREAELKAVTLSVGTKNRNAVAERKRRMFRSSTGSGLNFAADCNVESKLNEKSKDTMNTITITSMTAAGSKNIHLGQNKEPFGNSDDPFPMSDLSTASLSCTKFGPDSNLNLPSDTLAKTETDASLYASIEFNPDVTLSPTNSSSSPNHNGFRRSVDYVSTKDGKDPFNETCIFYFFQFRIYFFFVRNSVPNKFYKKFFFHNTCEDFRESSNPDEQFVLVHGKESQNNRNKRGQRIIRRHDPNDDRPIHGSIGGKYKVNDSAGVDEIPTVNEEKPIFEAKSQSAKYMAHIEAKNKGSNFSYITDSKQKYVYKRPSYLINPDERPINPSPRGSCYSPYDEIDAHVPVISPGTAGTAAAVAVLESQSLPGDPGSPVTMFSFDGQFASNNNSNIGRGSSKSFGGRGHRRSLSGRGGRQRTSIRVGGRGGRSSPEAKQRSTNINGIPSSSIDTSPSKEKSLAQNTVDEKQSTRNEGYLTNVDKKNGSVIRPSSPSYMDSGDDDDMYSDEDEAGGLYSDDFENDGKTQVDDDAIEVLAQLRHITIGGEASAAVAVSDLPEGDHTPLLGINYEQIERFQNDLRSREGVLYTDIRKFLLHNQKHKDTKTILEDKFGREKLDFCFEVEQLLYLERHCTPSARITNEK
eukprot:GSMAST32.ASY1.ANO1.1626.1 assembled CDS